MISSSCHSCPPSLPPPFTPASSNQQKQGHHECLHYLVGESEDICVCVCVREECNGRMKCLIDCSHADKPVAC